MVIESAVSNSFSPKFLMDARWLENAKCYIFEIQSKNQVDLFFTSKDQKDEMGLIARKPVFGVSDKAGFKPVSAATQTS